MLFAFPQKLTDSDSRAVASDRLWLWAIIIVGSGLRFYRLDSQSLWSDEGLQYYVATNNSIGEMLFTRMRSFHPPLSFLVNHIFLSVHQSEFFLRLPSVLFGIASLPLAYMLARELTSTRIALFSVALLALSPFHIWYSQEGRMYSQMLFFSLLSSVFLLQALKRGKAHRWGYYVLANVAGMYTHIFMGLVLMSHFVWVLLCRRRHLLAISVSGMAIALLFLPWVLYLPWVSNFLNRVGEEGIVPRSTSVGRAGFSWAALPYTFFAYAVGFSLGPSVAELHENRSLNFILQFLPSIAAVTVIFAILLAGGIYFAYKRFGTHALVFCLLGLAIPIVGTLAYSLATTFNARYTLAAFPYFCLFVGTALASITRNNQLVGTTAAIAVASVFSLSLYNHFTDPRYAKEDVRSAVTYWRDTSSDEPLLTFRAAHAAGPYLSDVESKRHFAIGGDLTSSIEQVLASQSAHSAYVLLARDWNRVSEKTIRAAFTGAQEKSYPGVKLLRISRKPSPQMAHSSTEMATQQ
jgi:uncharacterized membrane protein